MLNEGAESSYPAEIGLLRSVRQAAKPQYLGNLFVNCSPFLQAFSLNGACSAIVDRRYEGFCFPFLIPHTVSSAFLAVHAIVVQKKTHGLLGLLHLPILIPVTKPGGECTNSIGIIVIADAVFILNGLPEAIVT